MSQIKPLILPVETQVREFDAKLLLACVAAERGMPTYIGFQNNGNLKLGLREFVCLSKVNN